MTSINQTILKTLFNAKKQLSPDAKALIRSFLLSKMHKDGGFIDRSGNPDPYYSVFGLTLSFVFNVRVDIKLSKTFLRNWQNFHKVDFVHAISIVRCLYLLRVIQFVQYFQRISTTLVFNKTIVNIVGRRIASKIRTTQKELLHKINKFKSVDGGFDHLKENGKYASVYANFLAYGLFEDLHASKKLKMKIAKSCSSLKLDDGSFVNHIKSQHGVSSTTAAGIILLNSLGYSVEDSVKWLKKQIGLHGGFFAGEDVPLADVLSTATSLIAINMAGFSENKINTSAVDFVNLHWDNSGGFFGSIADQIPDVEYTFYGLLAIGLLEND